MLETFSIFTETSANTFVSDDNEINPSIYLGNSTDDVTVIINNENVNLLKIQLNSRLPENFVLEQNYPNPFNPSTKIKYRVPVKGNVIMKVVNSLGQEIATLVNEEKPAGIYEVDFDASNLASGIYFYSIKLIDTSTNSAEGPFGQVIVETKKMVLLR